jgi:hypothetical protein|eukprot:COSAG03_NODE_7006_length_977_cov_0.937358_2_plen_92_part_00
MQPIPMNMSRCSCLFAVVDSTFGFDRTATAFASPLLAPQVVAAKLKIPVGSQRLYFGDTLLQDNDGSGNAKDLSQWGISTGSIVRLDRRVD